MRVWQLKLEDGYPYIYTHMYIRMNINTHICIYNIIDIYTHTYDIYTQQQSRLGFDESLATKIGGRPPLYIHTYVYTYVYIYTHMYI